MKRPADRKQLCEMKSRLSFSMREWHPSYLCNDGFRFEGVRRASFHPYQVVMALSFQDGVERRKGHLYLRFVWLPGRQILGPHSGREDRHYDGESPEVAGEPDHLVRDTRDQRDHGHVEQKADKEVFWTGQEGEND